MVNQQLISYVKNQLKQGYNINSIKLNLARSGYTPEQIEEAAETVYGKPHQQLAKILLLAGGGAVILAALITALFFILSAPEEVQVSNRLAVKDVGLQLILGKNNFLIGEDLEFEVQLVNLGSGSNFEVKVKNKIYKDGGLIAEKDENILLKTQEKTSFILGLDAGAGDYQLETTIEYNGKTKTGSANFKISEEAVEESEVVVEDLGVLSGEIVKRIESILLVAETEPTRAKNLCLGLGENEKDVCLSKVGIKLKKDDFCTEIRSVETRDSCYVNIALSTRNYETCNKIVDNILRDACLLLGG